MLTTALVGSAQAQRLVETWQLLAATTGSLLELHQRREAIAGEPSGKPTRCEGGWILSGPDGSGAIVRGPKPVMVDLYVPQGHSFESEMLTRQGPLSALVMAVCGFTPVHAAGILTPQGFLALTAASGMGKSTVASLAWSSGWSVAGDDVLAMDEDITILPLPGWLRADAPWIARDLDGATADGRTAIPLAPLAARERLRGLVTLARGETAWLEPVRGAARLGILAHAVLTEFLEHDEMQVLHWASSIPMHRLTVPNDLARLQSSWPMIKNLLVEACG